MGAVLPIALAASAGLQAIGSVQSGYAASAAAGYNAKVAEQNAKLANQNAGWAGGEGEQNAGVAGLKSQQQAGAIKVAQAANNIDVNSGSALAVQKSQAETGMLNAMNIRSNAARQAYGYETQAAGYEGQAALDRAQAKSDVKSGWLGALTAGAKGVAGYAQYSGGSSGEDVNNFPQGTATPTSDTNSFLGAQPSSNFSLWQNNSSVFNAGSY